LNSGLLGKHFVASKDNASYDSQDLHVVALFITKHPGINVVWTQAPEVFK